MIEIFMPKMDANDEEITIEDIRFRNLDQVSEGDILFTMVSPKSTEDFISKHDGYLIFLYKEGVTVKVGTSIIEIYDSLSDASKRFNQVKLSSKKDQNVNTNTVASRKAVEYANEIGFDLSLLKKKMALSK